MASHLEFYAINLKYSLKDNFQLFEVWKKITFLSDREELKCNTATSHQVAPDRWHCVMYGSMRSLYWIEKKDLFHDFFSLPMKTCLKEEVTLSEAYVDCY